MIKKGNYFKCYFLLDDMLTKADEWILHTTTFPSIVETIVLLY